MKSRPHAARLSAAVAAALLYAGTGSGIAHARDLVWDATPGDGAAEDGSGEWNTSFLTWVDTANPGVSTNWNNSNPDSAIFGTGASAGPAADFNVDLIEAIIAQNITFAETGNNSVYSISAFGGGSLTLNGNITKAQNDGKITFDGSASTQLSTGNHTFKIADTGGDVPEIVFNGIVSGPGGITLDNDDAEVWGTVSLNNANTYTGATNITKGRLVITGSDGLGATSGITTISNAGTLGIGSNENAVSGPLTINEPITITRNTYTGGPVGEPQMFERYPAAIAVDGFGDSHTHTIAGPLVVDSTDARIAALSNTLVISSNITEGSTVAPGTGQLTLTGDFAGFVTLTGNNSAIGTTGIRIMGGVEVNVSNHNNLGGATAPITFAGDGTLHPVGGFMTTFGSHPVNATTFSGGLDVDAGQTFTIDIPLGDTVNAVGHIGKRGDGTLNLNSTINLRGGQTFWDAGIVNVNSAVTLHSLHLRSPVVNIGTGGSVTMLSDFQSFGQDSNGTNGGPDKAIVNITGSGQLIQTHDGDFNVSDNANTEGTINLQDNGVLTANGLVHVAKSPGGKGTINQSGNSTFTLNRDGNFTLVLGSRNGTGTYNLSGGTMTSAGEFYVGQGGDGVGVFNMTGGTVNQNDWFVVGREGGVGTVDISGGTFNHAVNGNMPIGESNKPNLMTLRGNAQFLASTGEFWVANGGGNVATLNVQDTATLSLNDWFVVGRFDAQGTLNQSGGTITKNGGGNTEFDVGGGPSSVVTVSGTGVMNLNSGELRVGQGGGADGTLNIQGNGAVNTNSWTVFGRDGGTGKLNLSGAGTLTKTGGGNFIVAAGGGSNGTFTQTGGTLNNTGSETWINEGGVSGVWNFSGGTANLDRLDVGRNGGGTAAVNLSGTAALNAGIVRFGEGGAVSGTVNLDGGTLQATQVVDGNSSGTNTLNLNGGLLKAGASNTTDWMTGGITANVKAGGAKLDSNGFNITINSGLLHDPLLGATPDGGLTKSGLGTATLTGTNTYTGGTTVQAGTLEVKRMHENNAVTITAGTLKVVDSSPTLPAHPSGDNAFVSRPTSLTIANNGAPLGTRVYNGKLDLGNNDLIIDYTGASPRANFEDMIRAGFNGGNFLGNGITSSTAEANNNFIVAIADNATLATKFGTAQGGPLFSGVDVDLDTILIKFTHRVDLDLDGLVTPNDASVFGTNYTPGAAATWSIGDMDFDGLFTPNDASIFGTAYNTALASVPEPGTLGVLGLAAAALAGRRRRSR